MGSTIASRVRRPQRIDQLTIAQAKVVAAYSPVGIWTIRETEDGWYASHGNAVLVSTRSRQPRRFSSVETAIQRLREEVGVTSFQVEARPAM